MFDSDGELVQIVSRDGVDQHRLRLIGAYESIFHRSLTEVLALTQCTNTRSHFACYTGGVILTCPLADGYFLMLYCEPECNIGQALRRLRVSRTRVVEEM